MPTGIEYTTRLLNGEYLEDGYAFIGAAKRAGLKPIANWGQDGWDLLDWPYYVLAAGKHVYLTYCEGDLTFEEFDSQEDLYRAIDKLAHWSWRHHDEEWIAPYPEGMEPYWLCGPYRKADICEVCGEEISYSETEKLRAGTDLVEHGDPSHLIRVLPNRPYQTDSREEKE